jgi:beta-phosphoglucomutase-like phosphatase (HAD superfamily)
LVDETKNMGLIEMVGIIFDLDGTLVDSYDLDERLYRKAVWSVLPDVAFRNSWHDYQHSTDSGVLREILTDHDLPPGKYYQPIRQRFGELFANHIQSGNHCNPIPGASAFLNKLRQNSELQIGIATGGWSHTAAMKLKASGLFDQGIPMASADDAQSRTEIMQICAKKMDSSISESSYVGDAEWDLRAARRLGWRFVGVGKRLMGKCNSWIPDFRDTTPFVNVLP